MTQDVGLRVGPAGSDTPAALRRSPDGNAKANAEVVHVGARTPATAHPALPSATTTPSGWAPVAEADTGGPARPHLPQRDLRGPLLAVSRGPALSGPQGENSTSGKRKPPGIVQNVSREEEVCVALI